MNSELFAKECTLISGRLDIIKYFLQLKEMFKFNFIKPGMFEGFECSANPILLDVSSIYRFSNFKLNKKSSSLKKKTLFLIPPDTPFHRRKFIYENFQNYLELPAEPKVLIHTINAYF